MNPGIASSCEFVCIEPPLSLSFNKPLVDVEKDSIDVFGHLSKGPYHIQATVFFS
ncbi:hypothetical protein HNR44_001958 [Geomicrobium halophilum]|uniref:Uncharacterized protein n=1 Tax=Geomicrobium halophilum TaxID=549000 RepID=A0A841PMJ9_9BACL|nr:hypothetical protein [Geomicrobium halophilum]